MFEFGVLGPLTVHRNGAQVVIGAPMVRRVLAVLLCRAGVPIPAPDLADIIWRGAPPASARKTLQVYVHRLRRALGNGSGVRYGTAGYSIEVPPDELDAARFTILVGRARTARLRSELPQARAWLHESLGLFRGPAYADISEMAPVVDEARRLDDLRLLALEQRIAVDLDLGRAGELAAELTPLIKVHPYREQLRGLAMLALYRAGRRAEALETFRNTRVLLSQELGVEPGALLQRLHRAMLHNDHRLVRMSTNELGVLSEPLVHGVSSGLRAVPTALVTPRELPAAVAGFAGRAGALRTLDGLLLERRPAGTAVISAIVGPPGVGKTALAVHWAHRVSDRFPDGQLFINLRGYAALPPLRPVEALSMLLRSLGLPPDQIPFDEAEASARYRSALADRRALVLLDNARSADQVRPLLPGRPGCLALVTSRDGLSGLVARDGARRLTLDALLPAEAHALLAGLLGADRIAAEPEATAQLAEAYAYRPLALRVAATMLDERPGRRIATLAHHPGMPTDMAS